MWLFTAVPSTALLLSELMRTGRVELYGISCVNGATRLPSVPLAFRCSWAPVVRPVLKRTSSTASYWVLRNHAAAGGYEYLTR
ncbi:hypothetical protein BC628DRAFT_202473 [Trametes gibbosa]|nr:hypothetical protein BC628DRAFT_202473 [Trametes gibbosa]